jgi:hypothetical protein
MFSIASSPASSMPSIASLSAAAPLRPWVSPVLTALRKVVSDSAFRRACSMPSSAPSRPMRAAPERRRSFSNLSRARTIAPPHSISNGTIHPKPDMMAIAISSTWEIIAMMTVYLVCSVSRANCWAWVLRLLAIWVFCGTPSITFFVLLKKAVAVLPSSTLKMLAASSLTPTAWVFSAWAKSTISAAKARRSGSLAWGHCSPEV